MQFCLMFELSIYYGLQLTAICQQLTAIVIVDLAIVIVKHIRSIAL